MAAPYRKRLIALLKVVFSAILLYFVLTKIDLSDLILSLQQARWPFLLAALFFFALSKVLSSVRLNLYFHRLDVFLTQTSNLKLYLLGMFYNLFLPGGIGGDAYKGYMIKKNFKVRTRRLVAVLLLDRLSGLLMLFLYACLAGLVSGSLVLEGFREVFLVSMVLSPLLYWLVCKRYFPYVMPVFLKSLAYSTLVQLGQLLAAYLLLLALRVEEQQATYLFVFLISSIVSVVPLTIGGIGSREVVFYYGALWLGLVESSSLSLSMLFFLITALVSLSGMYFHFRIPRLVVKQDASRA